MRRLSPSLIVKVLLLWICIGSLALYGFYPDYARSFSPSSSSPQHLSEAQPPDPQSFPRVDLESNSQLWTRLNRLLDDHKPGIRTFRRLSSAPATKYDSSSTEPLTERVHMSAKEIGIMRDAHRGYLDAIQEVDGPELVYNAGTRGIVTTAGGFYMPVFVASLYILRYTGSTLPVEVFVASEDEYDKKICEEVLPTLNARCVVLSDILGSHDHGSKTYQFKILSILFSSFESVLFLDSDCFPSVDPNVLFDSELFTTHGMITWPDYWSLTISPKFYAIIGQDVPPNAAIHAATESGQLMFNKRSHAAVILLSLYYNIYGPSHYYTLLCQGGPGEGDKETYVAAVRAINQPNVTVYTVPTEVGTIGFREPQDTSGTFHGVGMIQYFPTTDLLSLSSSSSPVSPSVFIHHHNPKLNPSRIFMNDENNPPYGTTANSATGQWHRLWGQSATDVMSRFNWTEDFEAVTWREGVCRTACTLKLGLDGDVGIVATRKVREEMRKAGVGGFEHGDACGVCWMYVKAVFGEEGKEEMRRVDGKNVGDGNVDHEDDDEVQQQQAKVRARARGDGLLRRR